MQYGSRVEIFEPDPSLASALALRYAGNDRVRVHQAALSDHEGEGLFVPNGDASNVVAAKLEGVGLTVRLRDTADVIAQAGGNVDVLKLNVEGSEYPILDRLIRSGMTERIGCLLLQFHPWIADAEKRRAELRAGLERTHRQLFCFDFVWERWDRR